MTLLEVYEGWAKDLQIGDEVYWDDGFRKVVAIAPCDACTLPCTRVSILMPPDPNHREAWLRRLSFNPNWPTDLKVLFKRPG